MPWFREAPDEEAGVSVFFSVGELVVQYIWVIFNLCLACLQYETEDEDKNIEEHYVTISFWYLAKVLNDLTVLTPRGSLGE